jgi:putative membrane protein
MSPAIPKGATPNTGSRARDHLANERTYLAWHRTGISVAALGVAVAKFAPHRGIHAVISGTILIVAGLLVSGYGTLRYRSVGHQLEAGVYTPARFAAILASTVITLLALLAVVVLVRGSPS